MKPLRFLNSYDLCYWQILDNSLDDDNITRYLFRPTCSKPLTLRPFLRGENGRETTLNLLGVQRSHMHFPKFFTRSARQQNWDLLFGSRRIQGI